MTPHHLTWRKSRRSEADGACVELAPSRHGMIGVRDSKAGGTGPVLEFTRAEWAAFITKVTTRTNE